MDEEVLYVLGLGVVALVVGAAGLLAPARWNPLQLRRPYADRVSPGFATMLPKVPGAGLVTVGLIITVVAVLMLVAVVQ